MSFPFTEGAAKVGETEKIMRRLSAGTSRPTKSFLGEADKQLVPHQSPRRQSTQLGTRAPSTTAPHTKTLFLRRDWPSAGVRRAGEVWTRRRQRALRWWTWKTISSGCEGDRAADRLTSRNWARAQRQMALAAGAKKGPVREGRVERRTRPGCHLYCPSFLVLMLLLLLMVGWGGDCAFCLCGQKLTNCLICALPVCTSSSFSAAQW